MTRYSGSYKVLKSRLYGRGRELMFLEGPEGDFLVTPDLVNAQWAFDLSKTFADVDRVEAAAYYDELEAEIEKYRR